VTSDADVERMARAGRRLRKAMHPADDAEDGCLQVLVQVVRVEHIEALVDMAERASGRGPVVLSWRPR
jgi:hypothetical protein